MPPAPSRVGRKPRARRRRRPEEAEAEILASAARLLRSHPSHEVTVRKVMEGTGLTREAFYAYFRDRYELIMRLVSPLRARLDEQVAIFAEGTGSLDEDGRRSLLGVARIYAEHGALLRALAEASRQDEEARRAWRDFTEPPIAAVSRRVAREVEAGRVPPIEAERFVPVLIGMNLAAFFERLVGTPDADVEGVVDVLHTVWLRAFYGEAPGETRR
jgi:TetR/AcrR family transcriptional regulator, ethionamide resistance regulator